MGYVLLEVIGGTFSVLQMLLLAYNFSVFDKIDIILEHEMHAHVTL